MDDVKKVTLTLGLTNQPFEFEAFQKEEETIITHASIKKNALLIIKNSFKQEGAKISYSFNAIEKSSGHCIVDCTFAMKNGYTITETGESTTRSLSTDIAKDYPYLEAQKRAFDRCFISFFQIDLNGRRLHSDSEMK